MHTHQLPLSASVTVGMRMRKIVLAAGALQTPLQSRPLPCAAAVRRRQGRHVGGPATASTAEFKKQEALARAKERGGGR